jgi:hypothetical protein
LRTLVPTFVFSATLAAVAFTASPARSYHMHGSFCDGINAVDRDALAITHDKVANKDETSARLIVCPQFHDIDNDFGDLPGTAGVQYLDRNPDQSLFCRMEVTDMNSVMVVSPERHSCATSGGCATSQPLFADSQQRAFFLKLDVDGLPRFSRQSIRCSVPRKSTYGFSGVAGYVYSND